MLKIDQSLFSIATKTMFYFQPLIPHFKKKISKITTLIIVSF